MAPMARRKSDETVETRGIEGERERRPRYGQCSREKKRGGREEEDGVARPRGLREIISYTSSPNGEKSIE